MTEISSPAHSRNPVPGGPRTGGSGPSPEHLAEQVYQERLLEQRQEVNAAFLWLFPGQWLFGIFLAAVVSPLAWEGIEQRVHPHVWAALLGGALLVSAPLFYLIRRPLSNTTPYVVAVGQMLFSALLIHLTGGRLETHFHVFGSLAILAFYLDRGVLLTAAGVVLGDHLLRGWFLPESVYGVESAGWWRSLEHGGWVLFEIFFLLHFAHRSVKRTFRLAAESAAASRELQDGERRLRLVIESACDAYAAMDSQGRIVEWSKQAADTFGWSDSEVMGEHLFRRILPEFSGKVGSPDPENLMREVTVPGQARRFEEAMAVRRDGRQIPVEFTVSAVSWKGGLLYNVFIRDITERLEHKRRDEEMHRKLMEASRQAGKAEVAVGVLHNVGNVLNSVNVSAGMIGETVRGSRVTALGEVVALMRSRNGTLPDFIANDPRGKLIPDLLGKLTEGLKAENELLKTESDSLTANVTHIRETVALQQSHARISGITEHLPPHRLLEDALKLEDAAMVRHGIEISPRYGDVPYVVVDRHKALQILVNLLRNAKQAMSRNEEAGRPRRMELGISRGREGYVRIMVRDNGSGIRPEDLTRIFGHGYTTRQQGHGFGLHISALAAREMKGELTAESEGPGRGAAFFLDLPQVPHDAEPSGGKDAPAYAVKACPAPL